MYAQDQSLSVTVGGIEGESKSEEWIIFYTRDNNIFPLFP